MKMKKEILVLVTVFCLAGMFTLVALAKNAKSEEKTDNSNKPDKEVVKDEKTPNSNSSLNGVSNSEKTKTNN